MNVFEYSARCERMFESFLNDVGKERKTTFFADRRVMRSWGNNLEFMCEWVIALNQKIWQHYNNNRELARVYNELWHKADEWCINHFKGEDLQKYYEYID